MNLKKSLILIGFTLLILTSFCISANSINETQARKYIEHIIDTLFVPSNHSGSYAQDLKMFVNDVTYRLLRRLGYYPTLFSFFKNYDSDQLYKEIVNESINFIEQKSFDYAIEDIKKIYIPTIVNDRKIISKVTKKIKGEVVNIVSRSSVLDLGVFTNYIGVPLYNKVHDLLEEEIKANLREIEKQTLKPKDVYPTRECPVCYEEFGKLLKLGETVKRIFLACGHNICVDCLRSWHDSSFASGKPTTCPLCRSELNIRDYASELWALSAPPF